MGGSRFGKNGSPQPFIASVHECELPFFLLKGTPEAWNKKDVIPSNENLFSSSVSFTLHHSIIMRFN